MRHVFRVGSTVAARAFLVYCEDGMQNVRPLLLAGLFSFCTDPAPTTPPRPAPQSPRVAPKQAVNKTSRGGVEYNFGAPIISGCIGTPEARICPKNHRYLIVPLVAVNRTSEQLEFDASQSMLVMSSGQRFQPTEDVSSAWPDKTRLLSTEFHEYEPQSGPIPLLSDVETLTAVVFRLPITGLEGSGTVRFKLPNNQIHDLAILSTHIQHGSTHYDPGAEETQGAASSEPLTHASVLGTLRVMPSGNDLTVGFVDMQVQGDTGGTALLAASLKYSDRKHHKPALTIHERTEPESGAALERTVHIDHTWSTAHDDHVVLFVRSACTELHVEVGGEWAPLESSSKKATLQRARVEVEMFKSITAFGLCGERFDLSDAQTERFQRLALFSTHSTVSAVDTEHLGKQWLEDSPAPWHSVKRRSKGAISLDPPESAATSPSSPAGTKARVCCKYCHRGHACGDTCIANNRACHVSGGCACNM